MNEFESQILVELHAIRVALEQIVGNSKPLASSKSSIEPSMEKEGPNLRDESQSNTQLHSQVIRYYFGTPDGAGFEQCNAFTDSDSPKVLYVIESADGINGRFYPLNRSFARLRSNANSFLMPLCEVVGSLDTLASLNLSTEDYGEVELADDYWKVTRKCIIKC